MNLLPSGIHQKSIGKKTSTDLKDQLYHGGDGDGGQQGYQPV